MARTELYMSEGNTISSTLQSVPQGNKQYGQNAIALAMELKISASTLIVSFNEGSLKGMVIKFNGQWCVDDAFGVSSRSGKVIAPVERKLTDEEFEYVKSTVLAYIEAENRQRKVKFSPK